MVKNQFTIIVCGIILLLPLLYLLNVWIFMYLWDLLIPMIFHGPSLTFRQAAGGLFLLAMIGAFFRATQYH